MIGFTGDPEFTYLTMCPEKRGQTIGMTGDCGNQFGTKVLVGDLTIGATDGGSITLQFVGEGDVTIVKEPFSNVFIAISLCCTGGCIAPIIAIFSGVKAFKKDPSSQPVFVQQVYPNQVQQNEYQKEWRH